MKKAITILSALFFLTMITISCTENQRAKNFGGKMTIELNPNEKLVNLTWKEDELWILTEDKVTGQQFFRENSSFGILQGEVIIK